MKYLIVTRKAIFVLFIVLLVLIIAAAGFSSYTKTASSTQTDRIIPIYRVQTQEKKIAVTFDAAWGADDTNTLISILGKYNAKATFFVVGEWARKYPDSIKAFYTAGHEIGNHSDSHTAYSKLTHDEIVADLGACNESVFNAIGVKPTICRAPSGDYTNVSETAAKTAGMLSVQWSVDSLDWQGLSCEEIVSRVVNAVESGSIILFHNDVKNTPDALDDILNILSQKGYTFVTVSELIYHENYRIDATGKQILNE